MEMPTMYVFEHKTFFFGIEESKYYASSMLGQKAFGEPDTPIYYRQGETALYNFCPTWFFKLNDIIQSLNEDGFNKIVVL